ncbi:hypothetical protein H4O20_07100 [Aequorivita sp. 609]|uniref:hypothetical protein n=1 Tax=Aequorivita TaxID=153265 RepID=UPI00161C238E|nr:MULTISPECIES: hypothetical protein [Aequorivita]MBB6681208.1 hypothetical protein [Aequorivita sp. 609]
MATFIEIANRLAKNFVTSSDKASAVRHIISEINGLIYTESKKPLDYSDKKLIVQYIGEFISRKRPFQYRDGGQVIISEQKDNTQYLDMVDYILNELDK